MKRRYVSLSWVCVQLLLLSACDSSSYQSGIEGSGVITNPVAVTPTITTSGEVTALGSIVVNGAEYDLTGAAITIDGVASRESDLVPGHVAVVEGELAIGATHGIARRVTVETAVAGRISATDLELNRLTILGQTIAVDIGAIVEGAVEGSALRGLDIGRDVQVSGFVDSTGTIHATRIDSRRASTPLLVTGRVANLDASARTFSVGGQVVSYATATLRDVASLAEGMTVRISAQSFTGTTLVADEVTRRSEGLPGQPGAAATLQGWVTRFASAGDFDVDGRRVSVASLQANAGVSLDTFVLVKGALDTGGVVAAREVTAVLPGRVVGQVTIDGVELALSGLMTREGAFRLSIEAPSSLARSSDSGIGQLVGNFAFSANHALGTGVLIGETCAPPSARQFCGAETPIRIEVTKIGTLIDRGSSGVIRVAMQGGEAVWPVHLGYWGGIPGLDVFSGYDGLFELHAAEFVGSSPVFMTVVDGRAFFQSADTGCTGNGVFSPYLDHNLYSVALEIRGCSDVFGHLNTDLEGLATRESLTPWGYDWSVLSLWLSTRPGSPSPAAISLWAEGRP